jgi:hypothetical protein
MAKRVGLLIATLILAADPGLRAQDEEKIQKLFQNAIEAMGGQAFLRVSDIVSEGNMFFFDIEGNSSGLIKYNDYTKLPDKSRNEVGNKKKARDVVVFNLSTNEGWILEGQKETKTATPEQMKEFRNLVKHSFDNIFRFRYKDPQNKLFYLGPGQGEDVQLEMVQLLDPENDTVTIYFDRASRLPAKIEYKSLSKRGVQQRHVEEYSQWHEIQGVKMPLRMDHFVNGRKSSQLFPVKVTLNNNLPDSFFSKPEPPK